MKSDEYRDGYSLESLRDLEQVPLTTQCVRNLPRVWSSAGTPRDWTERGPARCIAMSSRPEIGPDYKFALAAPIYL